MYVVRYMDILEHKNEIKPIWYVSCEAFQIKNSNTRQAYVMVRINCHLGGLEIHLGDGSLDSYQKLYSWLLCR